MYKKLTWLFNLVSADNGGCMADAIEGMLGNLSEELALLAHGEHTEVAEVMVKLLGNYDPVLVYAMDQMLRIAFDGPLMECEH